ncbi:MAG: hypothetical protein US71_C0001G0066 [Parcubacteria group bacterium GW2011_GWD2_38_12]|uniref:Uncharacterized protein n=1 Tax=Candidatus Magasanikbacteria bacterium GW2011_GWE2_42_7 TaxID=1619052 RepID=A0A0G1DJ05_9BACT|nr:MAG: hypothetical protein US06_C0001G0065 [Parcubacteria group bacterium GW2011_GWC2_36_17]KKQ52863.1 MAG: hypothetical protein US71_C0001G0066 [Parcubacteria group bacterium GW2011_GWD2_38_12]KKQ59066.1 MAG: hypothetical protein US79_C0001G0065 [Parcubacteria group bacterium GW2011_GWC1_38_17]KKQ59681.1 MAG: hypothetical protein US78_C0001G0041 [Parcubacteria group bacterium GW2011_GWD1_38_16]KKS70806.1 MAG: hypothetical protein UV42_C0043G0008 [Candidatus Magasanikbacteria bacterium GW2011
MGNLTDALKKYNGNSLPEDIIKGLQDGGYTHGLNPATEEPIFQNYLTALLNSKTNKELSVSLNNFKDVIKEFSLSSFESTKALNLWTMVLAFATTALVFVTIVAIFY